MPRRAIYEEENHADIVEPPKSAATRPYREDRGRINVSFFISGARAAACLLAQRRRIATPRTKSFVVAAGSSSERPHKRAVQRGPGLLYGLVARRNQTWREMIG
jgi:hypothetical protein